jgi:hypothetical protein
VLRKIVFVLIALALPLVAAQAASADVQYPPTGDASTTVPADPPAPPAESTSSKAPLARTGTDLAVLGGVAVVLMAGGAVVVVASRRRATVTA